MPASPDDPARTAPHIPATSTDHSQPGTIPEPTGLHAPGDTSLPAGTPGGLIGIEAADLSAFAPGVPIIPGYTVLGEIARGGMGLVLSAHDDTLDREVAIKVLLPGQASPSATARFLSESRITAKLPHPGIPPVHQLGTLPDGSPFLAMKLIRGRTLAAILIAGDLDRTELLAVFGQICQAVGFAHSVGIIHRDLKPLNVMVGAFGEVQVMDWGLARETRNAERGMRNESQEPVAQHTAPSTQHSDATAAGAVLGTPSYMPPEQARGEPVDRRADVFALGGILCAILTGKPPYTGSTVQHVLQQASRADLGNAFARLNTCNADQELITLATSCLQAQPELRPANGKAVADSIAAYRAGVEERLRAAETERAAAEARAAEEANTRREAEARANEQRKRRKVQFALFAALGLLIAAVGVFAWWQDKKATDQRNRNQQLAAEEADRLMRNAGLVKPLVAQCEAALKADDIAKVIGPLEQAEKQLQEGGADEFADRIRQCRRDHDALKALDEASDRHYQFVGDNYDIPGMLAGYRAALRQFGIAPGQTPVEEAVRLIHQSHIQDRLLLALDQWLVWGSFPLQNPLGDLPWLLIRFDTLQVAANAAALLPLLEAADPDPFRNEFRAAVPFNPQRLDSRIALLAARDEALRQPGRFALAMIGTRVVPRERLMLLYRAAFRDNPANWRIGRSVADGGLTPDLAMETIPWLQAAIALRPTDTASWLFLGDAYRNLGDTAQALEYYREVTRRDPKSSGSHYRIAQALASQGDVAGAAAAAREAVRIAPNNPNNHYGAGYYLHETGDIPGALTHYLETIRLCQQEIATLGSQRSAHAVKLLVAAHGAVALCHADAGDWPASLKAAQLALEYDATNSRAHRSVGRAHFSQKHWAEAEAAFRAALRFASDHPQHSQYLPPSERAAILNDLGRCRAHQGHHRDALDFFQQAIQLAPTEAYHHYQAGSAFRKLLDWPGALGAYREAVRFAPTDADCRAHLGWTLFKNGHRDDAITQLRAAIRLDPNHTAAYTSLGNVYFSEENYKEAVRCYELSLGIDPKQAEIHDILARSRWFLGDADGAAKAWKETARLDPKHSKSRQNLAVHYRDTKQYAEAARWFEELAQLVPANPAIRIDLARALNNSGKPEAARVQFQEAIRLDPMNPRTHHSLAALLEQLGDLNGAIAEYREAYRLDPKTQTHALPAIARALRQTGDLAGAATVLREYLKHVPNDASLLTSLAYTLADLGDINGAVAARRRVVTLTPKDAIAWGCLAEDLLAAGDPRAAEEAYRRAAEINSDVYGFLLKRFPLPFVSPTPRLKTP